MSDVVAEGGAIVARRRRGRGAGRRLDASALAARPSSPPPRRRRSASATVVGLRLEDPLPLTLDPAVLDVRARSRSACWAPVRRSSLTNRGGTATTVERLRLAGTDAGDFAVSVADVRGGDTRAGRDVRGRAALRARRAGRSHRDAGRRARRRRRCARGRAQRQRRGAAAGRARRSRLRRRVARSGRRLGAVGAPGAAGSGRHGGACRPARPARRRRPRRARHLPPDGRPPRRLVCDVRRAAARQGRAATPPAWSATGPRSRAARRTRPPAAGLTCAHRRAPHPSADRRRAAVTSCFSAAARARMRVAVHLAVPSPTSPRRTR